MARTWIILLLSLLCSVVLKIRAEEFLCNEASGSAMSELPDESGLFLFKKERFWFLIGDHGLFAEDRRMTRKLWRDVKLPIRGAFTGEVQIAASNETKKMDFIISDRTLQVFDNFKIVHTEDVFRWPYVANVADEVSLVNIETLVPLWENGYMDVNASGDFHADLIERYGTNATLLLIVGGRDLDIGLFSYDSFKFFQLNHNYSRSVALNWFKKKIFTESSLVVTAADTYGQGSGVFLSKNNTICIVDIWNSTQACKWTSVNELYRCGLEGIREVDTQHRNETRPEEEEGRRIERLAIGARIALFLAINLALFLLCSLNTMSSRGETRRGVAIGPSAH